MNPIRIPDNYNYIGVFLTLRCNMSCSYCINKAGTFSYPEEMTPTAWIKGLSRIETRSDLPLTLQGGEPTIYPGFYYIVSELDKLNKEMDLLTNGLFDVDEFINSLAPEVFKRSAKYASIRFSFHQDTSIMGMALKVWYLSLMDYNVGVWGIDHPNPKLKEKMEEMKELSKWLNIDYRWKEFLGQYLSQFYGTYKYPDAVEGINGKGIVYCKPSEILVNPAGYIFRCHADLYASRGAIGHILDDELKLDIGYKKCTNYGSCNPCDIKLKTNRFQVGGHCSVDIKGKEVMEETEMLGCPYCQSVDYEYDEEEDIYNCLICDSQFEDPEYIDM